MATHKIGLELRTNDICDNRMKVSINEDGKKSDSLEIGKGGIRYHSKDDAKNNPYIINWKQLAKLIKEHPEFRKK
jgi:hypothetical protein